MLNYEMFMEKLKESILNLSGWNSENVSFVPHEESKFGEDRLEIVCIESATHVGCDSLSTTALYHEYLNGKEIQTIADELVTQVRAKGKNYLYDGVVQIVDYKKVRKRLFIATVSINDKDALKNYVYMRDKLLLIANEKVIIKLLEFEDKGVGKTTDLHRDIQ